MSFYAKTKREVQQTKRAIAKLANKLNEDHQLNAVGLDEDPAE